MNTKPVFHGSDIEKICEYYHLNQEDIVNFGANVNPIGISTHVKQVLASHLDLLSSYPDRDYQSLRNTVSEYCGVPADYVLPGNGSSELISLLIESAPFSLDQPIRNTPESCHFQIANATSFF